MSGSESKEKRSGFCIYCGKSACNCPSKMTPGDQPPLRLYCSECGEGRSDCQCSPLWGSDAEREARAVELASIRGEVEECALREALKIEQDRNRTVGIRLSLSESFVLHATGLINDTRLVKSGSVGEVVGELLASYPTGYDLDDEFPGVGRRVRVSVKFKVCCLSNAENAARRKGASLNAYLTDHLGRCFIALDKHDDKKDVGYFRL